jgi:hypothetical protein
MTIQNIVEKYGAIGLSQAEYLVRFDETEKLFDQLADTLIASGDVSRNGIGEQVFCPIDLGQYALRGQNVRVVAQAARGTQARMTVPDREHRSLTLKIPDDPLWRAGNREFLNTYNSRQVARVSINSAFRTASQRSINRLEDFRSVLDEVLTFL